MTDSAQANPSASMAMEDHAAFNLAELDQRAERTRLLYEGSRLALLLMIITSLVFPAVLWTEGPKLQLAIWSGVTFALALLRLQQTRSFAKASAEEQQHPRWYRSFLLASIASAVTLDYAIIELALDGPFLQQTVLLGSLASVFFAGCVACGVSLRAFGAFAIPGLLPAAVVLLSSGEPHLQGWGLLAAIVLLTLSMIAWQMNRLVTASLAQRLHNQLLIRRLESMRGEAFELNGDLAREIEQRRHAEVRLREAFDGLERRVIERTAALRESEARLSLALEASELGMWDWDMANGEVHHSRMDVVFGVGLSDRLLLAEQQRPEVHPEDGPRVRQDMIDHLKGKTESYAVQYRAMLNDGSSIWIEDRGKHAW